MPKNSENKKKNMNEETLNIRTTEGDIREVCQEIQDLLIAKNQSYGDSALRPLHIFSRLSAVEGIQARLDDKLARLMQGNTQAFGEDPELDLMGYLILLRIAKKRAKLENAQSGGPVA